MLDHGLEGRWLGHDEQRLRIPPAGVSHLPELLPGETRQALCHQRSLGLRWRLQRGQEVPRSRYRRQDPRVGQRLPEGAAPADSQGEPPQAVRWRVHMPRRL